MEPEFFREWQCGGDLLTLSNDLSQGWTTYFGGYGDGPAGKNDLTGGLDILDGNLIAVGSSGSTAPRLPVQDPGGGAYFQPIIAGDGIDEDGFIVKFIIEGGSVVNIEEFNEDFDVIVYPNPFAGKVQIDFADNEPALSISIFDSLGKIIHSERGFFLNNFSIDLSHVPSGVYSLSVNQQEKIRSFKIVKK